MILKLLRSTSCLLLMNTMLIGCATAPAGDVSRAADARTKFARDYNSSKWRDVIADADMLKKAGALDAQAQLVVGMAYFKAGDYAGCLKHAKTLDSDDARDLQARCAYEVAKAEQQ